MSTSQLFAGNNSNLVFLNNLKNEIDNIAINDAAVSATLADSAGVEVPGMTWPAVLTNVSGSAGDYSLTLSNALNLVENAFYILTVTATTTGGMVGQWRTQLRALSRGS